MSADNATGFLNLEIETTSLHSVRPNFLVRYGHVVGVHRISPQSFLAFQRAVEHHVGIRRRQTTVDVDFHVNQTGHFADKSFQTFFDADFHFSHHVFR